MNLGPGVTSNGLLAKPQKRSSIAVTGATAAQTASLVGRRSAPADWTTSKPEALRTAHAGFSRRLSRRLSIAQEINTSKPVSARVRPSTRIARKMG